MPIAIALSLALVGCSAENKENESSGEKQEIPTIEKETKKIVNSELLSILPSKLEADLHYQGMAEFGYGLKIHHVQKMDDVTFLSYKGWFEDGMGGEPEKRGFYIDYLISKDEIYQQIKNVDTAQDKHRNTIDSIIPHQIVLQAPLQVGHSWTQEFLYIPDEIYTLDHVSKEPRYLTATHTITDIDNNNGKPIYTVETVVEGVEGYYKDTYKETKKWETGKGLVSFESTIPMFDGMPKDEDPEEILTFGYGLRDLE